MSKSLTAFQTRLLHPVAELVDETDNDKEEELIDDLNEAEKVPEDQKK